MQAAHSLPPAPVGGCVGAAAALALALTGMLVLALQCGACLWVTKCWQRGLIRCLRLQSGPNTSSVSVMSRVHRSFAVSALDTVAMGLQGGALVYANSGSIGGWPPQLSYAAAAVVCLIAGIPTSADYFTVWHVELAQLDAAAKVDALAHIPRPKPFLWAYTWLSVAASAAPVVFWLPYAANEVGVYLRSGATAGEVRSLDGVRALTPILSVLNLGLWPASWFALAAMGGTTDSWLPPNEFLCLHRQGVALFFTALATTWAVLILGCAVVANLALIWSLSEPRTSDQHTQPEDPLGAMETAPLDARTSMLRTSLTLMTENLDSSSHGTTDCGSRCRVMVNRLTAFATSWRGQTLLSLLNHLATIAVLGYGILFEGYKSLNALLFIAIAISGLGMLISGLSVCMRKYPQWKLLPADDSFRVTCVLKTTLVMLKALIVFELGQHGAASAWETVVTGLFFTSFVVMAMMTLAFSLRKVWQHPHLLEQVGVAQPRVFLAQYAISYTAAKLGIVLLMASGSAPGWFGCDAHCKLNFFSDKTLGEFLPPLLWVPFAVYSNNEVAQLIDGVWWNHMHQQDGQRRIGLSTAMHGYLVVNPLVQAIVLGCALLSFGYAMFDPAVLAMPGTSTAWGCHWPRGLLLFLVSSFLSVNGLMLLRLAIGCRCGQRCGGSSERERGANLRAPLIGEPPVSPVGSE